MSRGNAFLRSAPIVACWMASSTWGCGGGGGSRTPGATGGASSGVSGGAGGPAANAGGQAAAAGGQAAAAGGQAAGTAGQAAAAGTGGQAAAAGAAGAPAITVANCDSLGPVGKWERLAPTNLKTGPTAFVVDPVNHGTVYLGTGDACVAPNCDGVFKSTDCGATWAHVNTGRNAAALNGGTQWTFEIDKDDPQILYTNSGYGTLGLYKSSNGGVDWDDITPKGDGAAGFVSRTQMDPADSKHILMDWHADCTGANPGCFAETKDGGASWVEHTDPAWAAQPNVYLLNTLTWVISSNGLFRTTDGGKTWAKLPGDIVAGGHSAGRLYRAKDQAYYIGTPFGIIRSTWASNGGEWALLPMSGAWVFGITGDGVSMYAGGQGGFMQSAETDGLAWTSMPDSAHHADGCSANVDPDPKHNLVYASCGTDGFWRARVR